jgi:hypothetical protein
MHVLAVGLRRMLVVKATEDQEDREPASAQFATTRLLR